jgi:antitoxin component YwqK of YwqJK toxin-antitoxin module
MKTYEEFNKEEPKVERNYWDNGQIKSKKWYLSGELHREDGPAVQYWYKNGQKQFEYWYLNGKKHRDNGPVYQIWYENGQIRSEKWFLNNNRYSREEWVEELKRIGSPHYEEQRMLLNMEKYNI